METTENGCIILKQSEYDELILKSKENRAREIVVKYDYWGGVQISGDFALSSKLSNQIRRIVNTFRNEYLKQRDDTRTKVTNDTIRKVTTYLSKQLTEQYNELPWYKRFFIRNEYVELLSKINNTSTKNI